MISTLEGSSFSVIVTNAEVNSFAATWPCHGLDLDSEYLFQFDVRNGDLIDIAAMRDGVRADDLSESEDGQALGVLCDDACLTGAEELGLRDVLAIRFGHEAVFA